MAPFSVQVYVALISILYMMCVYVIFDVMCATDDEFPIHRSSYCATLKNGHILT